MTADHMSPQRSFQGLILALHNYWADYGCAILQPYDMEMGAGTFHPATFLRAGEPRALANDGASADADHALAVALELSLQLATVH